MDLSDVEAVLLDMDGTLVDSDAAVERAWTTWAGEFGADAAAVLAIAHGAPADTTVRIESCRPAASSGSTGGATLARVVR